MTSKIPLAVTPLSSSEGNFSSSADSVLLAGVPAGATDLTATSLPAALSFSSSLSIASTICAFFMVEVPLIPLAFAISFKSASASDSYFSLINSSRGLYYYHNLCLMLSYILSVLSSRDFAPDTTQKMIFQLVFVHYTPSF